VAPLNTDATQRTNEQPVGDVGKVTDSDSRGKVGAKEQAVRGQSCPVNLYFGFLQVSFPQGLARGKFVERVDSSSDGHVTAFLQRGR